MADAATKVKRRRDPLSPKPILDRKTLVKALKERGLSIKDSHLDTFYQLLHRQHYPDLKTFVDNYNLREIATSNNSNNSDKENGNRANSKVVTAPPQKLKSTKNAVSSTKGNVRRLPKVFLEFLADPNNDFVTLTSTIAHRPTSKDGSTTKMAIKLQDGHMVESVLMRHVSAGGSRATLCVSSQVGCAMGCTFCATGTMGIRGNLCTGEILEQLVHADKVLMEELCAVEAEAEAETETETEGRSKQNQKTDQNLAFVRNIVYMGMGEPLNNYDNVIEACRGMIDRKRWNLAHGRVTVSTVGVTPKMRKLTQEIPEINLALSLHAPNQPMREAIVPTAKIYPIQDMVDALDEHMMALVKAKSEDGTFNIGERKSASKRKRAMIEYVMLKGDTSTFECAHQLGKLCEKKHLVVNLIPYNQTDVKDKLSCPSEEHMKEFQKIVTSYGAFCTIRRTMGADIAGACGQLVVSKEQSQEVVDIEDGPFKNKNREISATKQTNHKRRAQVVAKTDEDDAGDDRTVTNKSLDRWIKLLSVGTVLSASVCALSIGIILMQRKRK